MGFLEQAGTNRLPCVEVVDAHSLECGHISRIQFLAEDLNRDSSFPFPVDEFSKAHELPKVFSDVTMVVAEHAVF